MEIAKILGPFYLVMGLSILLYVKSWQKLMGKWENDHLTLYPLSVLLLLLGLIIVNLHNVWEWNVWLIVTLVGWGALIKGVFYMLMPGAAIKWVLKFKNNAALLYVGGVVGVILGGVLGYYAYLV